MGRSRLCSIPERRPRFRDGRAARRDRGRHGGRTPDRSRDLAVGGPSACSNGSTRRGSDRLVDDRRRSALAPPAAISTRPPLLLLALSVLGLMSTYPYFLATRDQILYLCD